MPALTMSNRRHLVVLFMQNDLTALPEGRWKAAAAIAAILFVVTAAVYWQTTGFDFVNYDDHTDTHIEDPAHFL